MPFTQPLPASLSPSRLQDFQRCPRKFQHGSIDRIRQPASFATAKGNVVHHVLEHLFALPPSERTRDAAISRIPAAEADVLTDMVREEIGLDDSTEATLRSEVMDAIDGYFELEDPTSVAAEGVELPIRTELNGAPVYGILDRLDREPDGSLSIVDYKTGSVPRRDYDTQTFANAEIYAAMCEESLKERPARIRLFYVNQRQVLERPVGDASVAARRKSAAEAWTKITRYYEQGEFPATPSTSSCRFCAFRDRCRAAGVAVPV